MNPVLTKAERFKYLDEVAQVIFSRASRLPPPRIDDSLEEWDKRLTAIFLAKADVANALPD